MVGILLLLVVLSSCYQTKFDAKKWRQWNPTGEQVSLRWDMTDDLIENYLTIGKSKESVLELLGKDNVVMCKGERCMTAYSLGSCRSGINYGTLDLIFYQGKLVSVDRRCN